MTSVGGHKFVIVFGEGEGLVHLLVGEPPVAVGVIEVLSTVLEPDAKRPLVLLADEGGVDVAAADVGEATNMADDFAEKVGTLPGDGEGADAAGAGSADRSLVGIFGEVEFFADLGEEFGFQHKRVGITQGVVFEAAVAGAGFFSGGPVLASFDFFVKDAGIDENADGHRDFPFVDEVVESDGGAALSFFIDVGMAILKDHDGGGFGRFVLGGDVEVVLAEGAFEDLAAVFVARDFANGDSFLTLRVFGERWFLGVKGRACAKSEGDDERSHDPSLLGEKLGSIGWGSGCCPNKNGHSPRREWPSNRNNS